MVEAKNTGWIYGAVAVAALVASAPSAHAEARNEVRDVAVSEQAGNTVVRVRGTSAALFTAYKLDKPGRVVIDIAQAKLAEAVRGKHDAAATFATNTWAVSTVSAAQLIENGTSVRITVLMSRAGRYDIKADGNDLVITIMPTEPAPAVMSSGDLSAVRAEADAARREMARVESQLAQANREKDAARQAGANAEAVAAQERALAAAMTSEALRAKAEATKAKDDATRAQQAAQRADAEVARMRTEAASAVRRAEAAEKAAAGMSGTSKSKYEASAQAARSVAETARDAEARARRQAETAAKQLNEAIAKERAATEYARAQTDLAKQQAKVAQAEAKRATEQRQAAEAEAKHAAAMRTLAEAEAKQADVKRVAAEAEAKHANAERANALQQAKQLEQQRKAAEAEAKRATDARLAAESKAAAAQRQAEEAQAELARLRGTMASERQLAAVSKAEAAKTLADAERQLRTSQEVLSEAERVKRVAEQDVATRERAAAASAQQASATASAQVRMQQADNAQKLAAAKVAATAAEQARLQAEAEAASHAREVAALRTRLAAAATEQAARPLTTIADVRFEGAQDAATVSLIVNGTPAVTLGTVTADRAELIVDDAELAAKLERKLDVSRFAGPVRAVSSYRDRTVAKRIHVVAELNTAVLPTVVRDGNALKWRFASANGEGRMARTRELPPPVVGAYGATARVAQAATSVAPTGGKRKVYHGPNVNFDFKEAPIHDLLRILSEVGRVNIVVPDDIKDEVTVRMAGVPWDQALEVILSSKGLWYKRDGNMYRIAKRADLDAEEQNDIARRKAAIEAESPEADVLTLNYASASDLKSKLEALMSPKGKIEVDERTNALIVSDLRANRQRISAMALQLDTQTPQISIEARVVEARSTFKREFGVQWGGKGGQGVSGGNATGLLFPSSWQVAGGATDNQTNRNGLASPYDFAVNLPAKVGAGSGGALGLALGSIGGNVDLGLRLSALEDAGTVRIINSPKITVLNNADASIAQGVSIPIQVAGAQGTQTQMINADLKLDVKPYVSLRDCAIAMDVTVTKNEPDFVNTGARGDPTILRKEAKTKILVNDGETTVLGGIYTRNTGLAYNKVPFFGDLPLLGWFFKHRTENDDRTEVLVFITPKITNKAFLRCE